MINKAEKEQPNGNFNINNSEFLLLNDFGNYKGNYSNENVIQTHSNIPSYQQKNDRKVYPLMVPQQNIPNLSNPSNKIYPTNQYQNNNNPITSNVYNNFQASNVSSNYKNIPPYEDVLGNYYYKK